MGGGTQHDQRHLLKAVSSVAWDAAVQAAEGHATRGEHLGRLLSFPGCSSFNAIKLELFDLCFDLALAGHFLKLFRFGVGQLTRLYPFPQLLNVAQLFT